MPQEEITYTIPNNQQEATPNDGANVDLILTYDPNQNPDGSYNVTDAKGTYQELNSDGIVVRTAEITGIPQPGQDGGTFNQHLFLVDNPNTQQIVDYNGIAYTVSDASVYATDQQYVDFYNKNESGNPPEYGTTTTNNGNDATSVTESSAGDPTPAAPTIQAPADGTDTNNNRPVISGTGENNDTVKLTIARQGGGTTTATATVTNGAWRYMPPSALVDGSYSVSAVETSPSGTATSGPSNTETFTVDTTAPYITALADSGQGISNNGSGDLDAGKAVILTVTTSEPVYLKPGSGGATPTLTLNDGGVAIYTGGSGTAQQTFSYTVQQGQNIAALAVYRVNANNAIVTDAAGNPLNPSILGASVPSGTLTVDTTPPVVSSPTDTVAQNSGPTPIGIAAPSDNLTPAGNLAIAAGTLPTDGIVTLADGVTPVTPGEALSAAQLQGLEFTPTRGAFSQGSAFTYKVTDGAGNVSTGTAALNVGGPGAPTVTGTHATPDAGEATVTPFAAFGTSPAVTVTDGNQGATDRLTITPSGRSGTLTGAGTAIGGVYTLTGTATAITNQLDALQFTPTNATPNATATTTFTLVDASSAGPSSAPDSGTTVTDIAAAVPPTITNTSSPATSTNESTATPFTQATVMDPNAAGGGVNTPGSAADTLTITLQGGTGTLADGAGLTGTPTLASGAAANTYTLTGTGVQITAELDGLVFTPSKGAPASVTTTTFQLSDVSSVGGTSNTDATSRDTDTDSAAAPTVTGGGSIATAQNAPVRPFASASVADPNANSSDTLSIQVQGSGTLSGTGLSGGASGLYTLSGSAVTVTGELQGLTFTPAANAPGTTTTTTFALTDSTTAGPSATNAGTSVTDTVAPTPTPTDAVSISPTVTYADGAFTLSGTASSTAGVRSVEVSAVVDGMRQNLGAATVNPNGTFSFQDAVGDQQTFFVATLTDGAGGTATSADPGFDLTGGLGPRGSEGRQESFSLTQQVSSTLFRANGTQQVSVEAPGQTVGLQPYDAVFNHGRKDSTFVYTPGGETGAVDTIQGFKARGADNDVLSLKGADFDNSIADVLRHTGDVNGSAFITDPVTGDAIRLAGVSTAELKRKDFTFHA